jgi:hypothetical protein
MFSGSVLRSRRKRIRPSRSEAGSRSRELSRSPAALPSPPRRLVAWSLLAARCECALPGSAASLFGIVVCCATRPRRPGDLGITPSPKPSLQVRALVRETDRPVRRPDHPPLSRTGLENRGFAEVQAGRIVAATRLSRRWLHTLRGRVGCRWKNIARGGVLGRLHSLGTCGSPGEPICLFPRNALR